MNDVKKVSDAEIGMNVTRLRENADLSLDDVVRKMNDLGYSWTKTTLFNIEHGTRRLQAFEAYGLLQCLGFDPVKQAGILYLPHRKDNVQRLGEDLADCMDRLLGAWRDYRDASSLYRAAVKPHIDLIVPLVAAAAQDERPDRRRSARQEQLSAERTEKVEDRIMFLLENAPSHELSRRSLHNSISKRQREVLSPALENLKRSGRIKVTSHEDGSEWYEIIR